MTAAACSGTPPWLRRGRALAAVACLLSACACVSWRTDPLGVNYVAVSPKIGTAGMPQRDQFEAIAGAGYQTVIDLVPPAAGGHADEAELAARQGMRYYNVPVDFAHPTTEDYERFAALMRRHAGERVYVHCQMNLRASSFAFLYRVLELGEDVDRAYDDVLRLWQPSPPWRRLIEDTLTKRGRPLPLALPG